MKIYIKNHILILYLLKILILINLNLLNKDKINIIFLIIK